MNDPMTLAETQPADRQGIRTLLEEAATCRPLEEVTALVNLLTESGQQPNPGHDALRAAAVARPVHEVRRMVALLGEPPHQVVEADITLRAAAVGRPIEDVALLVSILGTEERPPTPESPAERWARRAPEQAPREEPEMDEEPYEPPYRELYDAPYGEPRGRTDRPEAVPADPTPSCGTSCAGPWCWPCWSAEPCTCPGT